MRIRGYGSGSSASGSALAVGTTTITSGTTGYVLYDNAGVVGEYPITGTGNVVMSASPTFTGTVTLDPGTPGSGGPFSLVGAGSTAVSIGGFNGTHLILGNAQGGTLLSFGGGAGTVDGDNNACFVNPASGQSLYLAPTAGRLTAIGTVGAVPTAKLHLVQDGTTLIAQKVQAAALRTVQLVQFVTSANASLGNVSGGCFADIFATTSTTSTDGTFNTLSTITFVANALIVNGDKVYFDYTLTTVSSATASRDFKLTFGGITIFDSTALVFGAGVGTVRIFGYLSRVSSSTCVATINYAPSGSATILGQAVTKFVPTATLTGLDLTATKALVLSAASNGTGAASGDIVLQHGTAGITGFGS